MPVKNLQGLNNTAPIEEVVIIPPVGAAQIKVTIDNGTEEIDITNKIVSAEFNTGVTSTIGDFSIEFLDSIKTVYNQISNFDDVYVYGDYGTEATTKRHRFKIEDKGFVNYNTTITGRGIGMIIADESIIYFTGKDNGYVDDVFKCSGTIVSKKKSDIIIEILKKYAADIIDYSQIEEDSTEVQRNYSEASFYDIIEELCGNTYYFYIDKDLVPHYFKKGSSINEEEAVCVNNKVDISSNSENSEDVYSRVRVYGNNNDDIPIVATINLGTTNTNGINKTYTVTNTAITTTTQAKELAQSYADYLQYSQRIGDISALYLPSLMPGDSFMVALPDEDIAAAYYNIKEFTIGIDNNGDYPFTTSFTIESKKTSTSSVIKEIISTQSDNSNTTNPYDLDTSLVIDFTTDSGTHNGTEVADDYLILSTGNTSGTWESDIYTLSDQITEIQFNWSGEELVGDYSATSAVLKFSLNGGTTWTTVIVGSTKLSATIPTGKDLKFQVSFNMADSMVKKLGILYNLQSS
jgi:hypothetical protein